MPRCVAYPKKESLVIYDYCWKFKDEEWWQKQKRDYYLTGRMVKAYELYQIAAVAVNVRFICDECIIFYKEDERFTVPKNVVFERGCRFVMVGKTGTPVTLGKEGV